MAAVNHPGELLSAFLDGELAPEELAVVVTHLDSCLDCIAQFHALQEARAAVRLLPDVAVPAGLLPAGHPGPELSAFLDGELNPAVRARLVAHVDACRGCRDELHELDAARTAVRALPVLEAPVPLAVRRIRRDEGRRRRRHAAAAGWATAVAAAAVAASLGLASASPPPVQVDLGSVANAHVARQSVEAGFTAVPAINPGGLP